MLQRLALYSTLGWLMLALGQQWDSWGFWCILGLFWASEHLTRMETMAAVAQQIQNMREQMKRVTDAANELEQRHRELHGEHNDNRN